MLGRFGGSRLSQLTDNIKALDVLPTLTEEFESDLVLLWGITAARGYRSNQVEVVLTTAVQPEVAFQTTPEQFQRNACMRMYR